MFETNSWNTEILMAAVIDLSPQFVGTPFPIFWQHPSLDPFLLKGL
jgi:hypothetical protein